MEVWQTSIIENFREDEFESTHVAPTKVPTIGLQREPIKPVEKIALPVSFGDLDNTRTEAITFDVATCTIHTTRFSAKDI
jgi:hypothetical protein